MKTHLKKLVGRRARKFYLWFAIFAVTMTVLLYQIANWRGAAAWKQAQERLEDEGENFAFEELVAERVPDAENFFAIPILLDLAKMDGTDSHVGPHAELRKRITELDPFRMNDDHRIRERFGETRRKLGKRGEGNRFDFEACAEYFEQSGALDMEGTEGAAAERVLAALENAHGEIYAELAGAVDRPHSQVTPTLLEVSQGKHLLAVSLPHLQPLMAMHKGIAFRCSAAVHSGDAEKAVESLRIMFRIADAARSGATLIDYLVAEAQDYRCAVAVREMLEADLLDEQTLLMVEGHYRSIDTRAVFLRSMRVEMFSGLQIVDMVVEDGARALAVAEPNGSETSVASIAQFIGKVCPRGWYDQNRATMANWYLDYLILPLRDAESASELQERSGALMDVIEEAKSSPFNYPHKAIPMVAFPAISAVNRKYIFGVARQSMVLTACALRRHKIAEGDYPDSLDELAPGYLAELPGDPCSGVGDSLRYRKVDGSFQLWSIGLDGVDDGGEKGEGSETRGEYRGDWVWRSLGTSKTSA